MANTTILDGNKNARVFETYENANNVRTWRNEVRFQDAALDIAGKLQVSRSLNFFNTVFRYGLTGLQWMEKSTTGGSKTHLPNEACFRLDLDGTSGASFFMQSKRRPHYEPGKIQNPSMTFNLGTAVAGVTKRVGFFDDRNGFFVEQDGLGNLYIICRTYISGATVDMPIIQANWNGDPLDGTGDSGITLDQASSQILSIKAQWYGVGRVEVGFDMGEAGGGLIKAHTFDHVNSLPGTYSTGVNLPIRYEIFATGATSPASMKVICSTIDIIGIQEDTLGYPFTTSNGVTLKVVTTRVPILSIRPHELFNGQPNHVDFEIIGTEALATSNEAFIEIIYNPTTLTGAAWADVQLGSSAMQYDITATAVSGGTVLDAFYVPAASNSSSAVGAIGKFMRYAISNGKIDNADAFNPDSITVAATSVTGTSNVGAIITWNEKH